jgi:hypothetical protein
MLGTIVTVDEARDGLLNPTLNAIGLNGHQHRLMINVDTPEIDSGVEWVASLQRYGVPGEEIRAGLRFFQQLIDMNRSEGEHARTVAQLADRLAREAEAAADGSAKVRQLAAALRPHLKVLKQRHKADPIAFMRAGRAVVRLIHGVPQERLLCTYMQTELGQGSFDLLRRVVEDDHVEVSS